MKVTPEMKAELESFLGNVFDKLELDEDGQTLVVDSCLDYITLMEPEVVIRDYINVKYVGRRPFYEHGKYGTWWADEVKEVDARLASDMIKHPDVFIKAAPGEKPTSAVDLEADPAPDEDEQIQELRDEVLNMRRKADVVEFVKLNYNQYDITSEMDDPRTTKLNDYKQKAVVLIDKYGLP